jgi:hypothetical protein
LEVVKNDECSAPRSIDIQVTDMENENEKTVYELTFILWERISTLKIILFPIHDKVDGVRSDDHWLL